MKSSMKNPSSTYAVVAATVVCLGGAAHAEATTSREAQALASATVSIVRAVDMRSGDVTKKIKIDALSGKVL
jgi:hypothetical protein